MHVSFKISLPNNRLHSDSIGSIHQSPLPAARPPRSFLRFPVPQKQHCTQGKGRRERGEANRHIDGVEMAIALLVSAARALAHHRVKGSRHQPTYLLTNGHTTLPAHPMGDTMGWQDAGFHIGTSHCMIFPLHLKVRVP